LHSKVLKPKRHLEDMEDLPEKVREYVREKFKDMCESGGGYGYRYFHALRVMRSAEMYARSLKGVDLVALKLACLLHDIGKLKGNIKCEKDEERHAKEGAKVARRVLKEFGAKRGLTEKVSKIIEQHHSKSPKLVEAEILKNADLLDEYGPIAVWRMFSYSALERKGPENTVRYWFKEGRKIQLRKLRDFTIEFFKRNAERRFEACDSFMRRFKRALNCEDLSP